jgi:hypothetical protein
MGTSNMKNTSKDGKFSILSNDLEIYALKMENEGSLWLELGELEDLREFLNSLQLPTTNKSTEV